MALGQLVPGPLGARLLAREGQEGRTLIVLELAGGNDGLNTVIPIESDAYRRARPTLALPKERCLSLRNGFALHPSLVGLKELYDEGEVSVVHGVGYPNPDRSHFRSMEIWHTARPDTEAGRERTGWLGRTLDLDPKARGRLPAVALRPEMPLAVAGERIVVPALTDPRSFGYDASDERGRVMRELLKGTCESKRNGNDAGDPLAAVRRAAGSALRTSEEMDRLSEGYESQVTYPATRLGTSLRTVAQMLTRGLGPRVVYLGRSGFDTHAAQAGAHERLLTEVGDSILAFRRDLKKQRLEREVLVLIFSEFGRRVAENASRGTDHGAAGPVFLIGDRVKPGLFGQAPDLNRLTRGDLQHTTDFRRVYATVIERFLGVRAHKVLGPGFAPLACL
jgi:uncharacterized protein (DUF1501 family)